MGERCILSGPPNISPQQAPAWEERGEKAAVSGALWSAPQSPHENEVEDDGWQHA